MYLLQQIKDTAFARSGNPKLYAYLQINVSKLFRYLFLLFVMIYDHYIIINIYLLDEFLWTASSEVVFVTILAHDGLHADEQHWHHFKLSLWLREPGHQK